MEVITRSSFRKDARRVRNYPLLEVLANKTRELKKAQSPKYVVGLKALRGYSTQYRIKVISEKYSYRIGAIIRDNTIWLVRFLPSNKIYQEFP